MLTDSDIHVPPNYATMQPPAVGDSYVDPAFGTTITRLTDASAGTFLVPEYSQHSSWNLDDTYAVIVDGGGGNWLYGADGSNRELVGVGLASEARWSRMIPNWLYFHDVGGGQIRRMDVVTGQVVAIGSPIPGSITFGGFTGDVSDNERIAVIRDERYVSAYDLANGTQFAELDTFAAPINGSFPGSATMTKDGDSFLIGFDVDGTGRGQGAEQFDVNANFMVQLQNAGAHAAMGRDVDGTQVLFINNANTAPGEPAGCFPSGIVKISLDGFATKTCLLTTPWGLDQHYSAHGNDGWLYVSTYDNSPNPPQPIAIDPEDWVVDNDDLWHLYTNEIFRVRADGSVVQRIAHTRSTGDSYWRQPHANISISGNLLTFGSDFQQNLHTDYADTYVINMTQSGGILMSDLQNFRDAFDSALPTAIPISETPYVPPVPPSGGLPEVLATMTVEGIVFRFDAQGELVNR